MNADKLLEEINALQAALQEVEAQREQLSRRYRLAVINFATAVRRRARALKSL